MKRIYVLLCFLLFIVFSLFRYAYAEEKKYIVKLNNEISLYESSERKRDNICTVNEDELQYYIDQGIVEYYEPDYEVELFSSNWNIDAVKCSYSWGIGCYGNGIKVAVIDSGIQMLDGINNSVLSGYNYLDESSDVTDNIGHGTFVSGIIASESNGIAYCSKIVPLKCFDKNRSTYVSDIINAVYDAVDNYDCKIINMSFGLKSNSAVLKEAVDYAYEKGAIIVAAVGNYGTEDYYYPAAYDNVIGVGSVNKSFVRSSFSQYNSSVFVTAPGESLKSLSISGYTENRGTSFSAPHAAALAAIAKCIDESITPAEFKYILSKTSTDLGETGYDNYYGYGLINFEAFTNVMLDNKDVFLSPIYSRDGLSSAVIYNNSDKTLQLNCIFSCYSDNKLLYSNVNEIILSSNNSYTFENATEGNKIKYMVWDSLRNSHPATKYRELNN